MTRNIAPKTKNINVRFGNIFKEFYRVSMDGVCLFTEEQRHGVIRIFHKALVPNKLFVTEQTQKLSVETAKKHN